MEMFSVNTYKNGKTVAQYNFLQNIVSRFPDKPWNWSLLSANPNISWDFIRNNPNLPWNWEKVCVNPNVTWEIVHAHAKMPNGEEWNWNHLCENPNVVNPATIVYVQNCIIDPNRLLQNPTMVTHEYLTTPACYHRLSANPGITQKQIEEAEDYTGTSRYWNWSELCKNRNLSLGFIRSHTSRLGDIGNLWSNPIVSYEDINNYEKRVHKKKHERDGFYDYFAPRAIPCQRKEITKNPNITWEIISKNPTREIWHIPSFAGNPNLTREILNFLSDKYRDDQENYIDIWKYLSGNRLLHDPVVYGRLIRNGKRLRK